MKSLKIKDDLHWIGTLDYDLRVFDIVMYTDYGTTYNSYVLRGSEKTAIFETVKVKFWDDYINELKEVVDPESIDYIILNHTEPDHSGSVEKLLDFAPNAKLVGSQAALNYMKDIAHREFDSIAVKDGSELSLGNKTLRFFSVPLLHWPDSIYTYVVEDKALATCDSFGAHYCFDDILISKMEDKKNYFESMKYYYDMIMGPFKPHVLRALKKIENLEIDYILTGHGPVLDANIDEYRKMYLEWSTPVKKEGKSVVIPYVSAYGYTKEMAETIAEGIKSAGDIEVRLYDMVYADAADVIADIASADGLAIGSPTLVGDALPPITVMLAQLNPIIHGGKHAFSFGSYGWSGEAVGNIDQRLKQLRMKLFTEGYRLKFKPNEEARKELFELGKSFGEKL